MHSMNLMSLDLNCLRSYACDPTLPDTVVGIERRYSSTNATGKVANEGGEIMQIVCTRNGLAALVAAATACFSTGGVAGELSGKVVWADIKNSALLVECQDDAGCKDVGGKKGETYTLVIPDDMKKAAESWKEGSALKTTFEDKADGGRLLKAASPAP